MGAMLNDVFVALLGVALIFAGGTDASAYDDPHMWPNRTLMVHLFEWRWADIANECETFLAKYNYGAVQISPPQDHLMFVEKNDIPWYVRYQPVSYILTSRSGNEQELRDMIQRCNRVGVRVVADVVLNHMVGMGQKSGANGRSSSAGSPFDSNKNEEQFPRVPYGPGDFHDPLCDHDIEGGDYQKNASSVRNCRLVGLLDLDHGKDYVRGKIRQFLNSLIEMGVAGFRIDAAKHMWPADMKAILSNGLNNLREDVFGPNQRPFVVNEVIDRGGEAVSYTEYVDLGRYTNFNFGAAVSSALRREFDITDLANMGPGYRYGNGADNQALNFIDNHDNQRDEDGGRYVLNYKDGPKYKMAVAYMLAWDYGLPRVMSSYAFKDHTQGPPNLGPDSGYKTSSPAINSQDETCYPASGWVCEHRWPEIRRMAQFRSVASGSKVVEIQKGDQMLAFARQGRGYIALRNSDYDYYLHDLQSTLPAGTYCDIASGEVQNGKCTGTTITVDSSRISNFTIPPNSFIAFHLGSRL